MGNSCVAKEKIQPNGDHSADTCERKIVYQQSDAEDSWKPPRRSMTDVFFLILMAIFLIILGLLVLYCMKNGDLFRIINGYDNCGNICGENRFSTKTNFTGNCSESNADKPFHLVLRRNNTKIKERYCVRNCTEFDGYRQFLNRCIPNKKHKIVDKFFAKSGISNFFQEASEDVHLCFSEILYLCLTSLGLSLLLLIALRYLVGYVVWTILFGVVCSCFVATTWLWILWRQSKEARDETTDDVPVIEHRKRNTYLAFAILSSVVTLIVVLVVFVLRKRLSIVVQLFRESGKALAAIPLMLLIPLLTFIFLGCTIFLWFFFALWIESSGHLKETSQGIYHYEKNEFMRTARWMNFFAMLWLLQFLIGCQHMVIAGAVSTWYFTRDKSTLRHPIAQSLQNLLRYHLGSIALGSLVIAVVQFIRILLKFVEKNLKNREGSLAKCSLKCCQCCLYLFETILKYLTRNAYIEVAMYGHSFCEGGRQAFRLLVANALRVTAINSVGDFTLFLGKVVVVIATVFIGVKVLENKEGLQHMWVPLTLVGLFAYFVAHCFMTVYEMIIDTVFLCFCEDCEKNDGVDRPYYMSRGLMSFVENSKKVIELHDHRKYWSFKKVDVSPASNPDVKSG